VSDRAAGAQDFPPIDAEQVRTLLSVIHQSIGECLALNARLAAALPVGGDQEAHLVNEAMFVALNDIRQRLDEMIGESR
jgi:hypothetical protein